MPVENGVKLNINTILRMDCGTFSYHYHTAKKALTYVFKSALTSLYSSKNSDYKDKKSLTYEKQWYMEPYTTLKGR